MKYLVDERTAAEAQRIVRSRLEPDPHAEGPGVPYDVHSLYLDDDRMSLCRETMDGIRRRFKLRMRWYDDTGPVFCEVKRRVDRVISKDRARVSRASAQRIADGARPSLSDLAGGSPSELMRFAELIDRTGASGRVIVSYSREAWVSNEQNDSRVTFDRNLSGAKFLPGRPLKAPDRPFYARMGGVIMELKFTGRFPLWMAEMVRDLRLERIPIPKYVTCHQSLSSSDFRKARLIEA